jgi:hypothetical protein
MALFNLSCDGGSCALLARQEVALEALVRLFTQVPSNRTITHSPEEVRGSLRLLAHTNGLFTITH